MRLTLKQAEQKMTLAWDKRAVVVPYRISGNRYVYAVTDHGEHWLPLESSWIQGRQVFAPADADWPDAKADPDGHLAQAPSNGHPRRIDLIVAYEADGARALPHINGNGQLVRFMADGEETTPPARTVPELYHWLQEHSYTPDGFKWLGWERGLRQRRQTYVLNGSNGDHHTRKEEIPCAS